MHVVDPEVVGDPVLIARSRAGNADAYAELFERHRSAATAFARSLGGANHADDLVAEAFVKVLDALRRDLGPTISFRSYLLTSIRSVWVNTVRSETRYDLVPDYDSSSLQTDALSWTDDPDSRFDNLAVADAFRSLPERWQAVLWYTAVEGLPHAEIGALLGIKANAVAALSFRAREGLREAYLSEHLAGTSDALCRAMVPLFPAYARGHLDTRKRPALEAHLESCASCVAALADLDDVNNRLGALLLPIVLGVASARSGWPFHTGNSAGASASTVSAAAGAAVVAAAGSAAVAAQRTASAGSTALPSFAKTVLLGVFAAAAVVSPLAGDMPGPVRPDALESPVAPRGAVAPLGQHGPGSAPTPRHGRRTHDPKTATSTPTVLPTTGTSTSAPYSSPTGPPSTSAGSPSHPPINVPSHPPVTPPVVPPTTPPTTPGGGTPASDVGLGTVTISRFGFAGQDATQLAVPVLNASPGVTVRIVVTDLVGFPVKLSSGWSCPGAVGGLPTDGVVTSTTTITCTYTGPTSSSAVLRLAMLTSGPSTASLTAAPPAGSHDPNPGDNTAVVTIAD